MYNTAIKLDRFHCNKEADAGGAEPYLWTLFFHLDMNTISSNGSFLETWTPNKTWTTRGMYANGVHAGDDVPIPPSMGNFEVALDDGGLGHMFTGFLCVLIDQDGTDGDAIKAGHEAFADAAHDALNDLAIELFLSGSTEISATQIDNVRDAIQSDVLSAIRNAQSWKDYFDDQDRLIGFGHQFFGADRLKAIANAPNPNPVNLAVHIRREDTIKLLNSEFQVVEDYHVFGHLICSKPQRPGNLNWPEFEGYDQAIEAVDNVNAQIDKLRLQLHREPNGDRSRLESELRRLKEGARPEAREHLKAKFPLVWKRYLEKAQSASCDR